MVSVCQANVAARVPKKLKHAVMMVPGRFRGAVFVPPALMEFVSATEPPVRTVANRKANGAVRRTGYRIADWATMDVVNGPSPVRVPMAKCAIQLKTSAPLRAAQVRVRWMPLNAQETESRPACDKGNAQIGARLQTVPVIRPAHPTNARTNVRTTAWREKFGV